MQQCGLDQALHYTGTARRHSQCVLKVEKDILHLICNSYSVLSSYVATVNSPSLKFLLRAHVFLLHFLKSEVLFLVYLPYIPITLGATRLS